MLVHSHLHYSYLYTHIKLFLQLHSPSLSPPTHPSDFMLSSLLQGRLPWPLWRGCFCGTVITYTDSSAMWTVCLMDGEVVGGLSLALDCAHRWSHCPPAQCLAQRHSVFANEWITTPTWMSLRSGNFHFMVDLRVSLSSWRIAVSFQQASGKAAPSPPWCVLALAASAAPVVPGSTPAPGSWWLQSSWKPLCYQAPSWVLALDGCQGITHATRLLAYPRTTQLLWPWEVPQVPNQPLWTQAPVQA